MPKYQECVHGNAVQVQSLDRLSSFERFGWGAVAEFAVPVREETPRGLMWNGIGPECCFHIPLASRQTLKGIPPMLTQVAVWMMTRRCVITEIQVWDGWTL